MLYDNSKFSFSKLDGNVNAISAASSLTIKYFPPLWNFHFLFSSSSINPDVIKLFLISSCAWNASTDGFKKFKKLILN